MLPDQEKQDSEVKVQRLVDGLDIGYGRRRNGKNDLKSFGLCSCERWSCSSTIRTREKMRSWTAMHAQVETLSRQLREDAKSDGRSEPRFKGEVLTGDASLGGS